ncbi:MAG: FliH/SctL family protein [Candidatus Zixiibacteriota bacterium]
MSRLLHKIVSGEKVIIGEFRSDLEKDREVENRLESVFTDVAVVTTIEGRKLVPIQELLKIEKQMSEDRDRARENGYEDGYQKGIEQGQLEAKKVINNFASLLIDANKQRDMLFKEAHRKILELVTKIASKVTFESARLDPEITSSIIAGTIEKLVDKSKIIVKVNPDHLPIIEQQIERYKGLSSAIKEITIEPDSRVRHGGCFIETPAGDIDARIDSQLEIMTKALCFDEDGV